MPSYYDPLVDRYRGHLVPERQSSGRVEVFYVPSAENLQVSAVDPRDPSAHRVSLIVIDLHAGSITMSPINTLPGHIDYLKPKYDQIKYITLADIPLVHINPGRTDAATQSGAVLAPYLGDTAPTEVDWDDLDLDSVLPLAQEDIEEILESLPPPFLTDYEYGLGFSKRYRFIVDAVERISECNAIVISNRYDTRIDSADGVFFLSKDDFEIARKSLQRAARHSQTALLSVNNVIVYNLLAERIGKPRRVVGVGRHPLRKLFTGAAQGHNPLSDDEQQEAFGLLIDNVTAIAGEKPQKLARLQSEIELVTLRGLIHEYEKMMEEKANERKWQKFLESNPFVLNLAFGYPIIKVQDQASIGGRRLDGRGAKITDFLVKNRMTDNAAIVEIKTPQTRLLNKSRYRGGVYVPSAALSGAVNQALDQQHQFEKEILVLKDKNERDMIQSYAVHCCLIVGKIPVEVDRKKSFELFRRNSKNVEIVTFDELLHKLKDLLSFLSSEEADASKKISAEDVPF